jgi:hypothetical protein
MGGPRVVVPPGGTSVATDGMRVAIERTRELSEAFSRGITAVRRAALVPHAPPLHHLEQSLRAGAETTARLHTGLRESVARYSAADHDAWAAIDRLESVEGAILGAIVGTGARLDLALGGPLAIGAIAALVAGVRSGGGHGAGGGRRSGAAQGAGRASGAIGRFLTDHPRLTSSPGVVGIVRAIVDGTDEAMMSAAGLPPALAVAAGASGRTGVSTSAGALMAAGPQLGMLEESPVAVQRVDRQPVAAPPAGSAERLARVPEGDQVRIERYCAPGAPDRYVVYVAPTVTFDPRPEGEPWDLASNVGGVGGEDVGAIRATELAMRDAGITRDSEVQLVGFSQGGMVATRIAADGNWTAMGLQTFGAPSGNVALPDGVHGMVVRNAEDFVPALAGPQTDHHLLQVERTVYADPALMPTDQPVPGHQRVAYAATAAAIDAARSTDIRSQSAALDDFAADYAGRSGSSITAYTYHATRVAASG